MDLIFKKVAVPVLLKKQKQKPQPLSTISELVKKNMETLRLLITS